MDISKEDVESYLAELPDEILSRISFSMPWQYDSGTASYQDPDDFPITGTTKNDPKVTRDILQSECFDKFQKNPHMNTAVRGIMGRLTGWGFGAISEIPEIQDAIDEIELDWRNRLYTFWPKYIGRRQIEGELFLVFTCHDDGFIEIDFIDPSCMEGSGDDGSGIIFHPNKTLLPLFYTVKMSNSSNYSDYPTGQTYQIPSIYLARDPNLISVASRHRDYDEGKVEESRSSNNAFKSIGGFFRFIVGWDTGLLTRRAISHLRTTIEWLNYYENLKKYEIDHKKSSGAYLWIFKITEPRAFKLWLGLTDDERRKTGIMARKTPGSSLVLPPGIDIQCINPNLTRISEQDTDILDMVSAGMNEAEDVLTGRSKGTYGSIKASRAPMSDRIQDEINEFYKYLKHDFWGNIFFLKSKISNFPPHFMVNEPVGFDLDGKVIKKKKRKKPEMLIDIGFPISEMADYETRAKGLLGVKHGSMSDTLGIPYSEIARRMGFAGYGKLRLQHALEKEKYPELALQVDSSAVNES